MAVALAREQFTCSICLDIFRDPVTLQCGHNFCKKCIKRFWDSRHKCECPLCKEVFRPRPELRVNLVLKELADRLRREEKQPYKPYPVKGVLMKQPSVEVTCDLCPGGNIMAVKSCFFCRASYCEIHLSPHLRDPMLMKHTLTDPGTFINNHLCRKHNQLLDMYCKTEQIPVCSLCTERGHTHHKIISIERASKKAKNKVDKSVKEFEQMIACRMSKLEELTKYVEQSKLNKDLELQKSVEAVTMVISAIEVNNAMLMEVMTRKQEAAEKVAQEHMKELKEEVTELHRRRSELQYLESSDDHLHLLQSVPSLSVPPPTRDWSKVQVQSDLYTGFVRSVFSKLVDVCHDVEKKLSEEEACSRTQYAVDVTLDSATAAGWLILSPDGKKVSLGTTQRRLSGPDDRRFDSCLSVLGKQSFTSGRHYWVVQVADKTDWDLGIAKESINRKGAITVRPDSGYWAICRRKGGSLSACAGPSVTLHLQETPQKVGIFLDYEEGLVSFYNAEANTHIYTYSGCTFTEPLYPYLNPCLHDNGKNTAPLIICPVEVGSPSHTAMC